MSDVTPRFAFATGLALLALLATACGGSDGPATGGQGSLTDPASVPTSTRIAGEVGAASAVKMIRSVVMKGLEALVLESVLAGQKAGVAETVLDSLEATYPGFGWRRRSAYMLERVATHGVRRSAEMREVARTLDELGIGSAMSRAAGDWQERIGALGVSAASVGAQDFAPLADALLAALESERAAPRRAAEQR